MILWCDGPHDPAENMRRDARLLAAAEAGAAPVLRLFRFAPHGITLGLHQRAERTLDLERCRADGIPWAGRPTGGRAIFHAQEWTYALATPIDDPRWGGDLREAYARASRLVLASLIRLGVPAAFAAAAPATSAAADAGGDACFASAAAHELTLEGRKLAGSAQRRGVRALLQQGSVLLGEGHLRLADYLAMPADGRERARESLRRSTAPAARHLGADAPLERWADALVAELGAVTRFDGPAGAFLLLPPTTRSYTPAAS
jgi:lipoyl(octanoyl) transferase